MHQADVQIGRASTWHQSDYSEERETCKNNPHSSTRMTPCHEFINMMAGGCQQQCCGPAAPQAAP